MSKENKFRLLRITTVSMSYRLLLRGQLEYMGSYFEVHAASSPGWELDEMSLEEGVITHPIHMEREPSPLRDLQSLLKLVRLMRNIKPDVVHSHTPKAGLLGMMAARIAGVKVRLHTVAGIPWMESVGTKRKILKLVEKLTYALATKVYSNSSALEKFILENKLVNQSKISVLANGSSNGIDTKYFDRSKELIQQAGVLKAQLGIGAENVIVFVGRLVRDKGIEELVSAFKNLQKNLDVQLLLVGPFEPERDPLSREIQLEIKENSKIITTGYVKDVRPYLILSTVLAFPSYREGFPNVPMQAGSMGLPSIVSNINGCNEIIKHKVNGLIIPVKDSNALENALRQVLTDQKLLATLSSNARDSIVQRYEQKHLWTLLQREYYQHLGIDDAL